MDSKKILMLVRTSGLEYDDRIRKEALSLKRMGYNVEIIANYVDNNASKGVTSYGVPYRVISLKTRTLFPSAKLLGIKMGEFWLTVYLRTLFKKYTFVWVHEEYMALNILVKPVMTARYIFDLHELPLFLTANASRKAMYRKIESRCHSLIVANAQRLAYMESLGIISDIKKYYILNNFPDQVFSEIPTLSLPDEIITWLNGAEYILLQGGGHLSRYPIEVLTAIKQHGKYKAIVVGPVDKSIQELLDDEFAELVYCAGYINQLDLPIFFDNAKFTIILYNCNVPNSLYCEPNRLYQAINRSIPVIVGVNPPMKDIVTKHNVGVVLSDDGRNSDNILDAIFDMEIHFTMFQKNIKGISKLYSWETQDNIIEKIIQ